MRDDLAPYDISSYAYEGGYKYRLDDQPDADDEPVDPGVSVNICGSWTGYHQMEEMERLDDGSYISTMVMGDARCERFFICLAETKELRLYPAIDKATSRIHVLGPSDQADGRQWLIDGRDEEIPAGTCFQIHLFWSRERKNVWWEEVGPKHASKAVRFDHHYSVVGSWTSQVCDDMCKDPEEDGVFSYNFRLGYRGEEVFQFCRDGDKRQMIYPSVNNAVKTDIPVRGPDDLGANKYWLVQGLVGEVVQLRLEVDDGKVVVSVVSDTKGEKVYESREGKERHDYCLGGSFNNWEWEPMVADESRFGVYHGTMTLGETYSHDDHAYVDFFNIALDGDGDCIFHPEVSYTGCGQSIVAGPDLREDCPWMVKGYQSGQQVNVVLDLNAVDRRKIVTWTLEGQKQLPFGTNLFEDGRVGGGDFMYGELELEGYEEDAGMLTA